MKKLYQVIFVDEYNNSEDIGYFKKLDDAILTLNEYISTYGDYKLEKGDIKEYMGNDGYVFDRYLSDIFNDKMGESEKIYEVFQSCMVRGFIKYFDDKDYKDMIRIFNIK